MKILVTGGCGFIGSNFVRHVLEATDHIQVINLDLLTYAGNLANLADVQKSFPERHHFIKGDISDKELVQRIFETSKIDGVVHFAAESHVDRSILGPEAFVRTNIYGTFNLLETCRRFWFSSQRETLQEKRFLHISTDEVYGSSALDSEEKFTEDSLLTPSSPYAASKAAADLLVMAYSRTYGLPVVISRCTNNYGSRQHREKFLPTVILNALQNKPIPVYGDGHYMRDWLHVKDHCHAIDLILHHGRVGQIYHIAAHNEWLNIDIARKILKMLDKPDKLIEFVSNRPGHDRRYAIDSTRIQAELNWSPEVSWEQGLLEVIEWYSKENRH